jgi:flagellar M-ring protein FliF
MDQIRNLINDLTIVQRISIVAAVLVAAGAIAALLHYHHEGDFRPLYTAMAAEDAAPVVQKLKESGVEYRLTDGGSVVMVPSERLAESRLTLAAAGLPKSGRIGFELFDKTNFGATELVEHINHQRALEGELERSVLSMAEVLQARVHLTFPRESVFLDQQQPAKASVMIKLNPGAHISQKNVIAVSNLVASAVEGLNPEEVAVIDMDGTLLSRPHRVLASTDGEITGQALEVRQQIERDLVAKINSTLEPLLGPDQFRAGASVECDMTSGEQQEETYKPDESVMVSSQKSEDVNERSASAGGIPGTTSNLPNPPVTGRASGGTSHMTENVTYQSSRLIKHTRIPQGVIRRMSLSVLVGQPIHWEGSAKNRKRVVQPPSPETMKTIREVIAGVTGFSAERGDQLIVETLPFESSWAADPQQYGAPSVKPPAQPAWLDAIGKYRNAAFLAMGGLVFLAVLIGMVRYYMPRRALLVSAKQVTEEIIAGKPGNTLPEPGPVEESRRLPAESNAEIAGRVRKLAQGDPMLSATILRMWLHAHKPEALVKSEI